MSQPSVPHGIGVEPLTGSIGAVIHHVHLGDEPPPR